MCVAVQGCECDSGWTGLYCQNIAPTSGGSKGGAIAGGVIGALAAVGLAGAVFYYRCVDCLCPRNAVTPAHVKPTILLALFVSISAVVVGSIVVVVVVVVIACCCYASFLRLWLNGFVGRITRVVFVLCAVCRAVRR